MPDVLPLILVAFWLSFWMAVPRKFSSQGWNAAIFWIGLVLQVPLLIGVVMLVWFYSMVDEWPMNIGGKPNWNLYHNVPDPGAEPIIGFMILALMGIAWIGVLPTWIYTLIRIRRTKRASALTRP